jgi:hypothetical protein
MEIILTVQSCEKVTEKCKVKYRLGISLKDSKAIFKTRKRKVLIELDNLNIETKTTCGSEKKGFDLYGIQIDSWIKRNKFCDYEKGKPTKLYFQIVEITQQKFLKIKFLKTV